MNENEKDTTRIDGKKVDREVGEAFKTFVLKKHGRIRGVFSDEITKALAMYLRVAGIEVGDVEGDDSAFSKFEVINKEIEELKKEVGRAFVLLKETNEKNRENMQQLSELKSRVYPSIEELEFGC